MAVLLEDEQSMGIGLVSIIVPTRNSERTILACLESVFKQSYRPIELVVIDNDSTDSTVHIATRMAATVAKFGPERSAQRNRGAVLAHGDYLLFVDSDMELSSEVVAECVQSARGSGAPAVVVPEISVGEGFIARCVQLERSCYAGDDSVEAARFFRRDEFEKLGGFDETLTGPEDWDLTIRVRRGTRLPRTSSHIVHNEGRLRLSELVSKKAYYAPSMVLYWRKHGRATLAQTNVVFRPAFIRNWRRLVRHPLLTVGVLFIKSFEALAALFALARFKTPDRSALVRR